MELIKNMNKICIGLRDTEVKETAIAKVSNKDISRLPKSRIESIGITEKGIKYIGNPFVQMKKLLANAIRNKRERLSIEQLTVKRFLVFI
jgi:hypothetical protein